jgi:hypothetical protein
MSAEESGTLPKDRGVEAIDYLNEIIQFINEEGAVVPVISNAFRLEAIFRGDRVLLETMKQKPEFYDDLPTIEQQLTKQWAAETSYPMSDDHNLARVAQYRQVELEDPEQAKKEYLNFINERLLRNNQNRKGYEDTVSRYQKRIQMLNFSNVVRELDLPDFPDGKEDPLRLLARLPLPIFITTSYFSFLEQALVKEFKEPVTQVLPWSGDRSGIKAEHLPNRDYEPTPLKPAVYHLFGLENYASTLVLSEDDYMDFLMNSAAAIGSADIITEPLQSALSRSRLLLLGYHLPGWDFRALVRFILEFRKPKSARKNIAIQLKPSLKKAASEKRSVVYLEKYFRDHKFNVRWLESERFIYELLDAWEKMRGE